MIARAALAAFLLASSAIASPAAAEIGIWMGPGPNLCHGCATVCDPAEALDHVPAEMRDRFARLMKGEPSPVPLRDGDLLHGTAYCGGWDSAQRRVIGDWPAKGWTVRDGTSVVSIIIIEACGNPAVLHRRAAPPSEFSVLSTALLQPIYTPRGFPLDTRPLGAREIVMVSLDHPTERVTTPQPIPLPGAIWSLLAGLAGLAWLRPAQGPKEQGRRAT